MHPMGLHASMHAGKKYELTLLPCSQFFNFVALPLFQTLCTAFPGCSPLLAEAKCNLAS